MTRKGLIWAKNKTSHWLHSFQEASAHMEEQEELRVQGEAIDRPYTKCRFLRHVMVQLKEKVTQMPLGLVEGELPAWLRNSKGMLALDTSDDNLCVFRCLAVYRGAHKQWNTRQARALARELYVVKGETEPRGLSLSELEVLEVALYVVNGEGEWSLYKIPSFEQGEVM